ncbi:PAGE4 [Cervus elaphus hippelaphus]|uniref:PAGE4 n=1 Tax=Cervus elaphus hippelaphus TaxID=46360 RepID=A0A212C0C7_CEREH|nr:P antigen family member 4 [Cervus canadensis]XP_043314815.1 P antigen family member 4 [Cervus canadensis]XP_043314816.1 P antigen family member 4 [Cervus canadensis]XP_043314817.1 P antigen family member 4 [Cervus canadensis]XP_043752203.1 P antigen family member 4 [Cervus elaphus]XP_043752204.1 P antigen family member 4 [Cervus elaphus]XP_043752205.1 P antigen family member 4 [Cervus elaphus]XP_043752207.1 P antigen family member 4 [Cervus elaphus]OWJ99454.1 PAGE4 [Cervus elaphus hippel
MSARVRSRSRGRGDGQESSDTAETVAARKLGGKKPQRNEPPAQNVDMEPGQEEEGGASVVQEPEFENPRQEMDVEKIEGELGDGPDVKGKIPPNVVPAKIPEGGDGQ